MHGVIYCFRFSTSERGEINLFTIQVPSKFDRHKPSPSLIVKWDCGKWVPQLSRPAGMEPLTQMTIRYSMIVKNGGSYNYCVIAVN